MKALAVHIALKANGSREWCLLRLKLHLRVLVIELLVEMLAHHMLHSSSCLVDFISSWVGPHGLNHFHEAWGLTHVQHGSGVCYRQSSQKVALCGPAKTMMVMCNQTLWPRDMAHLG